MAHRKDDATRIERTDANSAGHVSDEESFAETEVFVGRPKVARKTDDSATRLHAKGVTPPPPSTNIATVRERVSTVPPPTASRSGRPPPPPAPRQAPPPPPSLRGASREETRVVSVARAPLDDQGFVARYQHQGVLGEGGMGTISRSRDTRIGREVAVKTLRKEAANADARMRFEREARVQGQLEHPSIVPIYDLGIAPDGLPFFTMKRLGGETLANIMAALQQGDPAAMEAYPRRRLLTAFCQVCQAVAFANARGVVHRDLKPSNVMLGDFGEVYVLDWGLAKLTGDGADDDPIIPASAHRQTLVGEVMGTPGYMSPEQLRGEVDQIGPATDVYTLGVVLFEVLTLEPLHDRAGLDTMYNSTLGKLDQHLSERAHKKGVPSELCAVCIRATDLDPKARYASVRDLHDAVERFLEGHRDVKSRAEMAAQHAKTAVEAAILAQRAPEMRELAIRELGAALTLDPTHAGALETLSRLMLEIPPEMSAAAAREFAETRRATEVASRRSVVTSYGLWLCFLPFLLALGIRDRWSAALSAGSVVLATIGAAFHATGRAGPVARFAIYCLGTFAIATSCMLMGWGIVVPSLAAVHTVGFILYGDKRLQPAALALGALSVIIPFALQESGVLPEAYAFQRGRMLVLPHMTALPPIRSQLYLLLASLGAIIAPAIAVARLRDALEAAEERAFMHAWTLQNLVPARARETAAALRKGSR